MLNNKIILPGVNNTRDLGGYPAGGKRVKKGVLIRSGTLNRAGPETVFLLSDRYRVRHIVDLRMGSVIAGAPDPEVPGADYHKLPVVEMEDYIAASGDTGEAEKFMSGGIDRQALFDMAYERGLLSPEMYVLFLLGERGKNAYRKFFNILLTNDPDKGAFDYHKGIQIAWKDDVTQKNIVAGSLINGKDKDGKIVSGATLNNNGDIVLTPGTLETTPCFTTTGARTSTLPLRQRLLFRSHRTRQRRRLFQNASH